MKITKTPTYVRIQDDIVQFLDGAAKNYKNWVWDPLIAPDEPKFLCDIDDIVVCSSGVASPTTFRKALRILVKEGKVLHKKNPKFEADKWCSVSMKDELKALVAKEVSDHQLAEKTQIINLLDRHGIKAQELVTYGHKRMAIDSKDYNRLLGLLRRIH